MALKLLKLNQNYQLKNYFTLHKKKKTIYQKFKNTFQIHSSVYLNSLMKNQILLLNYYVTGLMKINDKKGIMKIYCTS